MTGRVASGPVLAGVDRAALAAGFAWRLRAAGVPVGLPAIETFVGALDVALPRSRSALYWAARICLVRDRSELAAFDAVFAAVFGDAVLGLDPQGRRRALPGSRPGDRGPSPPRSTVEEDGAGLPWATLPRSVTASDEPGGTSAVPLRLPSSLAGIADTPFDQLSPDEMGLLGRWLTAAATSWPTRRTRRLRPSPAGHRIALRPTLARARRTGWEPVELARVAPRRAPRRVVMLCDVSRSMQAQATAYLHLMRGFALQGGETFAFATRLTRLTGALRQRSAEVAVRAATEKVDDRFGGTRIATSLETLLGARHGQRVRGAIVIIGSDGWDADPPERLARAMARLRRRAFRVVWINPRAGAPGFAPRVGAMAAALPHCDEFLPADTFSALAHVLDRTSRCAGSPRSRRVGIPCAPQPVPVTTA